MAKPETYPFFRWRTVRVFISSTFHDMHAERDHLVKVVFPALRERLEKYRIHLIDIDLRWGVTREQAENDQVLELCLQQIDECQFFIGMVGERYGWVPTKYSINTIENYEWIKHEEGKSILELEILHGALNNPKASSRAFFYFRDTVALKRIPGDIKKEIYIETNPEETKKLSDLKERIRKRGFPFYIYTAHWDSKAYCRSTKRYGRLVGLKAFGNRVFDGLWGGIKKEYQLPDQPPIEVETDPIAEEQEYHERYIEYLLQGYVERTEIHHPLISYINGSNIETRVVSGPSGSGKSSALARLCREITTNHPEKLLIPHFVGASPLSTDIRHMLKRFCLELREHFGFTDELEREDNMSINAPAAIPEETDELISVFHDFVNRVQDDSCVVFVVDALNQFDDRNQPYLLNWLSKSFPSHVKLVVSCIDDPDREHLLLDRVREMKLSELKVGPLTDEERKEILRRIPSISAKTLDEDQKKLLLDNPSTENPLFLLVALEELRGFGSFELLNKRIAEFPREGDTVTEIFCQVIKRLEEEFNGDIAHQVLSCIAISRFGMSERELVRLLTRSSLTEWDDFFPILRQIRYYMLHRGELIDFSHQHLIKAVRKYYFAETSNQEAVHYDLAMFFYEQIDPSGDGSFSGPIRSLGELPYHLDGSGQNQPAISRLLDLPRRGFIPRLIERTHDVVEANRNYAYFFRACLREKKLQDALQLARNRSAITHLGDWLSSGILSPLLPYIGADSALWNEIKSAFATVENVDERVKRLIRFTQPGLSTAMYASFRNQFDRDIREIDDTRQQEFLCAIARSKSEAMPYILNHIDRVGLDDELITTVIENLEPLCRGSNISTEKAVSELAKFTTESVDTFVAAVDAFTKYPDHDIAIMGLNSLTDVLERLKSSPDMIRCPAALSHAFVVHEKSDDAKTLTQRCIKEAPSAFTGEYFKELYLDSMVDAGVRLLMASAPFQDLWSGAVHHARAIASKANGRMNRGSTLAGFLQIVPWISSATQRFEWLNKILAEINDFLDEKPNDVHKDISDYGQMFVDALSGESLEEIIESSEIKLVQILESAFIDVLAGIDRVMPGQENIELLDELLIPAAYIRVKLIEGDERDKALPFFKKVIPILVQSANSLIAGYTLKLFVVFASEARLLTNEAGDILEMGLTALAANEKCSEVEEILELIFDEVEQWWCRKNKKIFTLLFFGFLRSVTRAKRLDLLHKFSDRILYWQQEINPEYQDMATIQWASALLSLGDRQQGERILRYVHHKQIKPGDMSSIPIRVRLRMAEVFLDAGANEDAAALLHELLVDHLDLNDTEKVKEALSVAKNLIHANSHGAADARSLFLTAFQQHRKGIGQWKKGVDAVLLNKFRSLNDRELTQQLLNIAEKELLHKAQEDSTFAARWYVALALSGIDRVEVAKEVRRELKDWEINHKINKIRDILFTTISNLHHQKMRKKTVLKNLTELIEDIENDESYCKALQIVTRCLNNLPLNLIPGVLKLIISSSLKLAETPGELEDVLEILCQQLTAFDNEVLVFQALEDIFDLFGEVEEVTEGLMSYMGGSLMSSILNLIEKQTNRKRLQTLLNRMIKTSARLGHDYSKKEYILKIVKYGMQHLHLSDWKELFKLGIELSDGIDSIDKARQELVILMVQSTIKSGNISQIEFAVRFFIDNFDNLHFEYAGIALTIIYREIVTNDLSLKLTENLAGHIKDLGVPSSTDEQAEWAVNLLNSPLDSIALPIIQELLNDMDRFATGTKEFSSLEHFLSEVMLTWPLKEVKERIVKLVDWAVHMPKVLNEDWRKNAFISIMRAGRSIPPPERNEAQLIVLREAFAILNKYGRSALASNFVHFDMNDDVANQAIELYLQKISSDVDNTESVNHRSYLLNLIISNLDYNAAPLEDQVLNAFCDKLDQNAEEEILSVERSKLARIAFECEHKKLRERLDSILDELYKAQGLVNLEEWDLYYLAKMPEDWWINHSTEIKLANAERSVLLKWIEYFIRESPDAAIIAIILALQWISQENPTELHDFWLEVMIRKLPMTTDASIISENASSSIIQ